MGLQSGFTVMGLQIRLGLYQIVLMATDFAIVNQKLMVLSSSHLVTRIIRHLCLLGPSAITGLQALKINLARLQTAAVRS